MKNFAAIFLVSLFLGAGVALAGGGDFDQPPQQMPQSKIVINVPEPKTNWQIPVGVAVVTALGGVGVALVRRNRKGN